MSLNDFDQYRHDFRVCQRRKISKSIGFTAGDLAQQASDSFARARLGQIWDDVDFFGNSITPDLGSNHADSEFLYIRVSRFVCNDVDDQTLTLEVMRNANRSALGNSMLA